MYHNDYNLRQLLELALRVPEVGAVNFNILYHILKTIIENQGLERVKPVFNLEGPLIAESIIAKSKLEVSLKRSLSAECLPTTKTTGVSKDPKDKDSAKHHAEDGYEKQSTKWNTITLYKRLDAVEDEISEFHVLISQLIDKIANFERISGLQETKFMKKIADLQLSIQSNEEVKKLAQELECLSSDVSMLKSEAVLKTESEGEDQQLLDSTKLEHEIKLSAQYEKLSDEFNEIKKYLKMEPICITEKAEKTTTDELKFIESSEGSDEEEDKGEAEKAQDKVEEVPVKADEDQKKVDEDQGKTEEYQRKDKEDQRRAEEDTGRTAEEDIGRTVEEDIGRTAEEDIGRTAEKDRELSERSRKPEEDGKLEVRRLALREKDRVQVEKGTVKELTKSRKDLRKDIKDFGGAKKKDSIAQADLSQWDFELLNISSQVNKLIEKCTATDKMFSSDISAVKEKNLIMEQTLSKCDGEIEVLKANWDGMVHNFESIKENLENIEKQVTVLTELPGLKNRIEQLEGYVYTGHEYELEGGEEEKHMMRPRVITPSEKFISKAEKITEKISVADKKAVEILKPVLKKTERSKGLDYLEEGISEDGGTSRRRFLAVSRNIALIRDMEKKKHAPKLKEEDFYEDLVEEEDYLYDEPPYETAPKKDEDFGISSETVAVSREMAVEHSADIKTSTFTSPDILEEHSRQLRGQVIVFVKNRLHVFEIDLQHIESNLVTMKKKIEVLEKNLKEIGEKLMFMDANFSQRIGDLAALKEMAENHQVSIVTIMHHLDRKAEAYAVNQKVSRKELTVIEDRVVKLCVSTSSEIRKLEEKLSESLEKFNLELDKKLFTEEFEVRLEFLLHKIKILGNKFKETSIEGPALDFNDIRPVEIKKFVLCKDGTRVKEARKKMAAWKHRYTSESIIPMLTQHLPDREASPKTAIQIQNELEQASIRESKRYVEGAYTKIQMEERNIPFRHDYIPILYQDGPLDITPHDSYYSGKHFNSLTTHNMILPRPNEIRTLRAPRKEKMIDRMPWMQRQSHLQGRVDHCLLEVLRDRGTVCNHGHLVMPDYIVPGYTGCRLKNPLNSAHIFKRCCPLANYDYDIIQHKMPYEYQRISEPCKQITPIVPSLRLTLGRKEWL